MIGQHLHPFDLQRAQKIADPFQRFLIVVLAGHEREAHFDSRAYV